MKFGGRCGGADPEIAQYRCIAGDVRGVSCERTANSPVTRDVEVRTGLRRGLIQDRVDGTSGRRDRERVPRWCDRDVRSRDERDVSSEAVDRTYAAAAG